MGFPGGSVVKNSPAKQETLGWSLGQEETLEKGTATHPSILALEIPWTEEPGELQSLGSQKTWTWLLATKQKQQLIQIIIRWFNEKYSVTVLRRKGLEST